MLCRRAAPAAPRTVAAPRPSAVAHRLAGRAARPSAHVSAPRLRRFYATDRNVSDTQAPFDDASLQRVRDPFEGISQQPFPKEVAERLMQRIPPEDIEIRPDGLIYLPEIKYRRVLNTAIGPGGWALMPRAGTVAREEASYSREFALFCFGRFVAQARGEQGIGERGFPLNLGFLDEAAKSNALMRCCKDIGVASELWDPAFITEWKAKHAVDVWVEHVKTGEKRKLWRRKDRGPIGYPYKEVNLTGGNAPANVEAPPVVTADTFTPGPSPALGGHSGGHGPGRPRQRKEADGAPATAPSPAASSGEFDMSAPVPSALKKVAGKTWADVVGTEDGRRYLSWVTSPDAKLPAQLKTAARKALDLHSALSAWETPDKDPAKNE